MPMISRLVAGDIAHLQCLDPATLPHRLLPASRAMSGTYRGRRVISWVDGDRAGGIISVFSSRFSFCAYQSTQGLSASQSQVGILALSQMHCFHSHLV